MRSLDPKTLGELNASSDLSVRHYYRQSRETWLEGEMFDKFWTRPQRGKKLAGGEVNARERMSKLCECTLSIGPHDFDVKLFLVTDDTPIDNTPSDDEEARQLDVMIGVEDDKEDSKREKPKRNKVEDGGTKRGPGRPPKQTNPDKSPVVGQPLPGAMSPNVPGPMTPGAQTPPMVQHMSPTMGPPIHPPPPQMEAPRFTWNGTTPMERDSK